MIYVDNLRFFDPSQLKEHVRAHSVPAFTAEKGEGKRLICDLYNDGSHFYARILGEEKVLVFVRLPFKEFQHKRICPQDRNCTSLFLVPEDSTLFIHSYGHISNMFVGHIGMTKEGKIIWFRRFTLQEGRMLRVRERGAARKFLRTEEYLLA